MPQLSAQVHVPDLAPIRRALLSVSDKAGLVPFARALAAQGAELISTGGTAKALRDAGLVVRSIDELTGFPEMMEGRVKTLHPKVHGGLLGVRTNAEHAAAMQAHDIVPIDLVCVNLYPFAATVAKADCTREEAIENIDIGGPSMLRGAAKNHAFVTVVTDASQYDRVLAELAAHKGTTLQLRRELAARTFALTAAYDGAIAAHFAGDITGKKVGDAGGDVGGDAGGDASHAFPESLTETFTKVADLRHGENPQQSGALYASRTASHVGAPNMTSAKQLHGKELSYNNLLDASAAVELADALAGVAAQMPHRFSACVMKHTNPCGAASARSAADAVKLAIAGDPLAAYGGILALSAGVDAAAAEAIAHKDHFFEVIAAPSFAADALALLQARWQNVRLLALEEWNPARPREQGSNNTQQARYELRSIAGGVLVQTKDTHTTPLANFALAAGPAPSEAHMHAASFLEAVGRALLSNAVVIGGPVQTSSGAALRIFGAGAGQMDRVASCRLALHKSGELSRGAVAYSDAFFPFADGPTLLADGGVQTIVHPGGSKRDADTFALCNAREISCLLTGTRHFRH